MEKLVVTGAHKLPAGDQRAISGIFFALMLAAWQYCYNQPGIFNAMTRPPMYLQIQSTGELCLGLQPGEPDLDSMPPAMAPLFFAPLAINRADQLLLQTVSGIGPGLAELIVQWRQDHGDLQGVGDLQDIPGIGKKRAVAWAEHFSFAPNK